jgi:hypothetical protein
MKNIVLKMSLKNFKKYKGFILLILVSKNIHRLKYVKLSKEIQLRIRKNYNLINLKNSKIYLMIMLVLEITNNYHKLITGSDQELIQKYNQKLNKLV